MCNIQQLISLLDTKICSVIPEFIHVFDYERYINGETTDLFKFYLGNKRIDGKSIALIRHSNKHIYVESLNDLIKGISYNMKKIREDEHFKEYYEEEIIEKIDSIQTVMLSDRITYLSSNTASDKKVVKEPIKIIDTKSIFGKAPIAYKQVVG